MEPRLVAVPEAIPAKVYTTERVGISRATHDNHLTLWKGYANKTNEIRKALQEIDVDPSKANQIYSPMRGLKVNYAFAYGGFINHNVYFETIGGQGGPATGMAGRGWVFLGFDHAEQRVHSYIGDAQDTFPTWDHTLLLAMDVYEHAYYLDFQTARLKYIEAYMQVIDWDAVNARLAKVLR